MHVDIVINKLQQSLRAVSQMVISTSFKITAFSVYINWVIFFMIEIEKSLRLPCIRLSVRFSSLKCGFYSKQHMQHWEIQIKGGGVKKLIIR